jgi:CRISPR-associated protein Cmr2
VSPDSAESFLGPVVYCLAYERWGPTRALELYRLLPEDRTAGREPEEQQLIDTVEFVLRLRPEADPGTNVLPDVQQRVQAMDDPKIALVMGGATKIKQYVFESAKLPEIRGASALLDRINRIDLPALFGVPPTLDNCNRKRVEEVQEHFAARLQAARPDLSPPECPECVIYANGGEILAFAPVKIAALLADEIEYIYTSETLVANSVAVWRECSLPELHFGLRPTEFTEEDFTKLTQTADERLQRLLTMYYGGLDTERFRSRKTFGEVASGLVLEKLRRREGNGSGERPPKPVPHFETNPYARRCESCEHRLAVVERRFEDELQGTWFCEPCARKRAFGQKAKDEDEAKRRWFDRAEFEWRPQGAKAWAKTFEDQLRTDQALSKLYYGGISTTVVQPAEDLTDIAAASHPAGFVAALYADANGMGNLLERLENPGDYRLFSQAVDFATRQATFRALAENLHPYRTGDGGYKHPFEVLSVGGDDVFLYVPAHAGLPIAIAIAKYAVEDLGQNQKIRDNPRLKHLLARDPLGQSQWRKAHRVRFRDAPQSAIALSSGVVIAQEHTPVFLLQRLAEQLLKSAKRKARDLRALCNAFSGATIDFMSLKSMGMIPTTVEDYRKRTLRSGNLHFTSRPFTVPETKALIEAAQKLKATDFPRSQLYHLREQLRKGFLASTLDYLYFQSRSRETQTIRGAIDHSWVGLRNGNGANTRDDNAGSGLWIRHLTSSTEPEWETILPDLVEIYDFVNE